MSYSIITNNIIKPIISLSSDSPVIHVLYEKSGSMIDNIIAGCDGLCLIPNQKDVDLLSYDLYLTTNPIFYSSYIVNVKQRHIHDLVYFMHDSPSDVKKEDKFLIQDKLSKSNKICKDNNIKTDWHIRDTTPILEYGIPEAMLSDKQKKSVVVLNTHNNKTIEMIYRDIKHHWPDSLMLSDISDLSYDEIYSILQEYCICIELQDNYNIGVAIANGCRVITNRTSEFNDYTFVSKFNDISNILQNIKDQLNYYENYDNLKASRDITKKYSFSEFSKNIYSIIIDTIRKPVLL